MAEFVIQLDSDNNPDVFDFLERIDYQWKIGSGEALKVIERMPASVEVSLQDDSSSANIKAYVKCVGDYQDDNEDEDLFPAIFDSETGEYFGW